MDTSRRGAPQLDERLLVRSALVADTVWIQHAMVDATAEADRAYWTAVLRLRFARIASWLTRGGAGATAAAAR